jgi:uncharacterized protein (TIGR03435 family)
MSAPRISTVRCAVAWAAAAALGGVTVLAQSAAPAPPAFDVASLKPAPPRQGSYPVDLGNTLHGKVTLTNVTLSECLRFAFNIHTDAQISGPAWIADKQTLFEIVGQAPPDTPKDTLRLMTLTLLTERFHLVQHRESREVAYLDLSVDKKGPTFHEAAPNASDAGSTVRTGRIVSPRISMLAVSVFLSRLMNQPVLDHTGLKGVYDIKLEWDPGNTRAQTANGAEPAELPAGPSVFTALHEQLGLKLESRKGPLDVIVVDHADRIPSGN